MPCYSPLQGFLSSNEDGSRTVKFCNALAFAYKSGVDPKTINPDAISIPCGGCMGCRLERSRIWAMRCVHEAQLHKNNCFITLTYSPDNLPVGSTLVKRHFQLFMKRFRKKFGSGIRFYMCGEYGELEARPHYHACIFGFDFADKVLWKMSNQEKLYVSKDLSDLWGLGFCTIGDVTFESAAYVARYVMKKITGSIADEHYAGRLPEYTCMSRKPGIARAWFDQFRGDVYPKGYLMLNGVKCTPPRYYDNLFSDMFPNTFEKIKARRSEEALKKAPDNTYERLQARLGCLKSRLLKLVRNIE